MTTYEPAELVYIGAAEETILGFFNLGIDFDYTTFGDGFIYKDDSVD